MRLWLMQGHKIDTVHQGCLWIVLTFWITLLAPSLTYADEQPISKPDETSWVISADRIRYDPDKDEYIAEGNVRVTREGRDLTAETVRINQTTRNAWADGNVTLQSEQDTISARQMTLNLDEETGSISDGTLFFAQNHLYLSGKAIEKTGPETYHVKQAVITSCDGDDPAWRLTGKDLEVTVEGYAVSTHTALWAKKIPVLYTPYFIFPVKLKRQSGLLMPEFGHSDRKGTEYLQPFFWAINDHMDATITAHYMSERGTRWGLEYRYAAGPNALGTFVLDGFKDRHVDLTTDDDDDEGDHQEWGYSGDAYARPNRDRYWFRGKVDQNLFWGLNAKLDLDWVSDQDYLKEFQDKTNGFDETRQYYLKTFGRDIDDYTSTLRLNQLNINRLWSGYSFNTDIRWYDNVIKRTQDKNLDTIQQLPAVTFDGTKKKIADTPIYFDLVSGYTHFYRQYGSRSQRIDLYPRVYYPMRLFNAISVEPSAGLRQTAWRIDYYDTAPIEAHEDQKEFYRNFYDLKLDTSTEFYRVFNIDSAGCDRLKHTVRPQIIYEYIPEVDQDDYPNFDAMDRIEPENLITYSLTNTLIARKPALSTTGSKAALHEYIPFLRFALQQSFDIDKERAVRDAQGEIPLEDQPFSDILAELDITPGNYFRLDADALWSVYDNRFNGYNAAVYLWDSRGDSASFDYRFTRETDTIVQIHSLIANGKLKLASQLFLRGNYERDLENRKNIETGVGLTYQAQCWGIDLDYTKEIDEEKVAVIVRLTGLGSLNE